MKHDSDHWLARYRTATAAVRERASMPVTTLPGDAWDALVECFDSGRGFCFVRSVDAIERVAMRSAWEGERRAWGADALARYRAVQALGDKRSV
jgi:hypothetical protein